MIGFCFIHYVFVAALSILLAAVSSIYFVGPRSRPHCGGEKRSKSILPFVRNCWLRSLTTDDACSGLSSRSSCLALALALVWLVVCFCVCQKKQTKKHSVSAPPPSKLPHAPAVSEVPCFLSQPSAPAGAGAGRHAPKKPTGMDLLHPLYWTANPWFHYIRPYYPDSTVSRPICEVKQGQVGLVLAWGTSWEVPMLYIFLDLHLSFYTTLLFRNASQRLATNQRLA